MPFRHSQFNDLIHVLWPTRHSCSETAAVIETAAAVTEFAAEG